MLRPVIGAWLAPSPFAGFFVSGRRMVGHLSENLLQNAPSGLGPARNVRLRPAPAVKPHQQRFRHPHIQSSRVIHKGWPCHLHLRYCGQNDITAKLDPAPMVLYGTTTKPEGDMARPTDDPKTGRIDLRLPPRVVAEVDEWRRIQDDIPARSEAMRRLIEFGLKAEGQIDRLEEDIVTLRIVAREWAAKAGADQKVLDAIDSDDPGAASSNPWLRKMPRSAILDPQSHVTSLGFRRASGEDDPGHHHPRQPTPKKPKKG